MSKSIGAIHTVVSMPVDDWVSIIAVPDIRLSTSTGMQSHEL